jgi:predicted nucleotidyltransferase
MKGVQDIELSEKDRKAIIEAARVLRECFPIEGIILFGSKVRGDDDDESDIDLLVLTSRKMSWKERATITDALFDIQLVNDVVISTLIVDNEEWDSGLYQVLPIHDEVLREGVAA